MGQQRIQIRDAQKTACETITTANGHAVEVGSVRVGVRRWDKVTAWPEIQIHFGDEERTHHELVGTKLGLLRTHLVVWAKGSSTKDAEQECEDIVDSIEQVLEKQTGGKHITLSYITDIIVDGVRNLTIDYSEHGDRCVYVADVMTEYQYARPL